MTPEQISKWAVEVGMVTVMDFGYTRFASPKQLHDFATLVRNAALDEAAVKCGENYKEYGNPVAQFCLADIRKLKS